MKLYIVRGLPGAGKTTYARSVAPLVVEPDMFRYTSDGEYVFDSAQNEAVNKKAISLLTYAMRRLKIQSVAFSAVLVKEEHVIPLVALGKKYGYTVCVVECYGSYGNTHNVPDSVVSKMAREFVPIGTDLADDLNISVVRRRKDETEPDKE